MGKITAIRFAKLAAGLVAVAALAACSVAGLPRFAPMKAKAAPAQVAAAKPAAEPDLAPFEPLAFAQTPAKVSSLDGLISKYSAHYDVPESLIRRVIQRESGYNPAARNGPYLGLMQIRHDTARSMGYTGSASGLLDAETNLKYAVKYLRGAYIVGGRSQDQAMRNYSRGYYYDAKRQGLLEEAGLR
jgi:soluble lytic murein transglycosylase-like protein